MQTTIEVPAAGRKTGEERAQSAPGLLCVANFPSNTGYAWNFIEGLYARDFTRDYFAATDIGSRGF